jgi:hypothetical protein
MGMVMHEGFMGGRQCVLHPSGLWLPEGWRQAASALAGKQPAPAGMHVPVLHQLVCMYPCCICNTFVGLMEPVECRLRQVGAGRGSCTCVQWTCGSHGDDPPIGS